MDVTNIIIMGLFFALLLILLGFFILSIYYFYKINKKINEMNVDISDALTKTIAYLNNEFKSNAQAHQDTIDWHYKNLEKINEFNGQYFNILLNQLNNNLVSMNVIMELLGYRPKFDESQIEKPKVNYAEPPAPQKIEGLRINDKDK